MTAIETLPPDVERFRLGIFARDFSQPIAFQRVIGPLAAMQKQNPRLELVPPLAVPGGNWGCNWNWLAQCDALFYSAPNNEFDLSVLWFAKQMGLPIWSEYVDDFFDVPPTNPNFQSFKNKRALREMVSQAIEWSDAVTFVSETCKQAYPFSDRGVVLEEACHWPASNFPRRKCITWRGLPSHAGDVETILDQLCAVARDFPEWEWVLLGEPSEEFEVRLEEVVGSRLHRHPYYPTPFHFMEAWKESRAFLHLVPLADNQFNRCKSNLAWLEASAMGAAVIGPSLPEWRKPGVIQYSSISDFESVLRAEMARFDGGSFHPNVKLARNEIYPKWTLNEMNSKRWAILRALIRRLNTAAR